MGRGVDWSQADLNVLMELFEEGKQPVAIHDMLRHWPLISIERKKALWLKKGELKTRERKWAKCTEEVMATIQDILREKPESRACRALKKRTGESRGALSASRV